ncbi:AraC family transcriptional regulator [Flavobacterium sp. N3904]|uniref:AraC family transcriptional regulator n=1 Tax=Flavobacterium sp. N3904 TaxID=2986835 RepID=UPI0022256107|nr:AraC family transcriptional regulator [Flavobacterium sp. N3904]
MYQMLFEMATGNLTFRLQRDGENNQLDELIVMLNTTAEKLQLLTADLGYINPHYTYQSLVQATLILDKNFTIKSFSAPIPVLLGHEPQMLFEQDFHKVLAKQSIPLWEIVIEQIATDKTALATVQLLFVTSSQHLVPSFCTVSRLLYSNSIIINSITTILQDLLPETTTKPNTVDQHQSDTVLVQNVREYILKNLEAPLPSTNELSKIFNVNEFKLKDSFRHFFNTSIYKFYTEERLKKAHLMIQQTVIPIKEIAIICGYINYTNFYKAFKKRYNYSPSELKRDDAVDNSSA